ncbi:hypothetical protein [Bacteroides pyogenes]|uniref:hypothetical protein n=1 Tax=Bacteroides pyogenes TaxID=310300 RepID=UPI003F9EFFC9
MYRNLLQKAGRNIAEGGAEHRKRWGGKLQKMGESIAEGGSEHCKSSHRTGYIHPSW